VLKNAFANLQIPMEPLGKKFMALEIGIWLIFAIGGTLLYLCGVVFKTPHLFLLGCAMLLGSGALLWGFDGLLLDQQLSSISAEGVLSYSNVEITMENVGLSMLALVLVAISILSALIMDFSPRQTVRGSPFHYG